MPKNKKKCNSNMIEQSDSLINSQNVSNIIVSNQIQNASSVPAASVAVEMVSQIHYVPYSEYNKVLNENTKLYTEIAILRGNSNMLEMEVMKRDKTIEELRKENEILRRDIDELKSCTQKQQEEINFLKEKNKRTEALNKLHDCDYNVNKNFKYEYKKWFNKTNCDYVPDIGIFVREPPQKEQDGYKFWEYFNQKFPGSNDSQFRQLYLQINDERCRNGAHVPIKDMTYEDFDNAARILFSDYDNNKKLYDDFRNWLFLFPVK